MVLASACLAFVASFTGLGRNGRLGKSRGVASSARGRITFVIGVKMLLGLRMGMGAAWTAEIAEVVATRSAYKWDEVVSYMVFTLK